QYPVRRFQKGEIILVQGEVPKSAYIVKKGVVKSYNLTAQGEEKPISFDVVGEMFPIAWMFGKAKFAQYYYEAFSDCEVYALLPEEYIGFLKKDPAVLFETFDGFVSNHINHQMRINALEQSKAAAKVLYTIHFLCLRFGREIKADTVRIELPLTQQDLANFMGLTRETTGIELKRLQRQGVLSYRKQNYLVKTNELDELLDEDYDQGHLDK
ncbi:Crp/Fnr family transcriptional regulator, partial [Candidatus Saccharibacteria bacterium]|nr:Crp/Fnr family transcriptional regulator [Candidatus Saccharibacteria bacterium]